MAGFFDLNIRIDWNEFERINRNKLEGISQPMERFQENIVHVLHWDSNYDNLHDLVAVLMSEERIIFYILVHPVQMVEDH